jgi:5-methylcytosine-specific restriction endonuclease McrA
VCGVRKPVDSILHSLAMVRVVVIAAAQVSAERMLRQNGGFLFQYRRNAPKGSPFAPHRRPPNCRRSPASAGDGYQAPRVARLAAAPAPHRVLRRLARRRSNYCVTCDRTSSGRIRRSSSARHAFQELHPCPSTGSVTGLCPGYVVDHIVPLKRGGSDAPENMQWQTRGQAKAKDRVE